MSDRAFYAVLIAVIPWALYFGILWLQFRKRRLLSRYPLTAIPRPPGYSLQQKLSQFNEDLSVYSAVLVASGTVAGLLYWIGINIMTALVISIAGSTVAIIQLCRVLPKYANYKLGLMGEQAVGSILNTLAHDTIQVHHDYQVAEPGQKPWNIDHIVLTSEGVFLIETKTRRKLKEKNAEGKDGYRVEYDGTTLHFPFGSDHFGLRQAKRNAEWLSKSLSSAVGVHIPVSPILTLPGWMVERKGRGDVHVMNEKELLSYFKRPKPLITPKLQQQINHQLKQHCMVDLTK
ncbi:nuclease-related domain-containing protein [Rubritalea spongiae]|uniref:Nuclease-related domain-containing protein n=1 Tax=Rubritalea spongiae TaxID=430797 RepID=A0ABW5DXT8_9BACT